jgi:hypothetical protein
MTLQYKDIPLVFGLSEEAKICTIYLLIVISSGVPQVVFNIHPTLWYLMTDHLK